MDLLALADVAELLGEPKHAIDDAATRFGAFIPTAEFHGQVWFYSEALDVLRVITDHRSDAVDDASIEAYLTRHFPLTLDPEEPAHPATPAPDPPIPNHFDPANLASIVSQAVAATLAQAQPAPPQPEQPKPLPPAAPAAIAPPPAAPFDPVSLSTLIAQAVSTALAPQSAMIQDALLHLRQELIDALFVDETDAAEPSIPAEPEATPAGIDDVRDTLTAIQDAVAQLRTDLRRLQDQFDAQQHAAPSTNGATHHRPAESAPTSTNGAAHHAADDDDHAPGFLKRFTAHTPRRMGRNLLEE